AHVDTHNLTGSLNAVFALSAFEDGGIVVEDPSGPERASYKGQVISGRVVPFRDRVLQFDAQSQKHWTQPWKGTRQVLVAYSVPLKGLAESDIKFLHGLNFQLPFIASPPAVPVDHRPWAFEIFAGSASLSKAWHQAGLQVLSFDIHVRGASVPMVPLDLTQPSAEKILWDLIRRVKPIALHVGMPCGTSSRARERKLPAKLVAAGAPEPQPLRDAQHPLGLPHIDPASLDGIRVHKANQLYALSLQLALYAARHKLVISLENPSRSWAWAALIQMLRALQSPADEKLYNALEIVGTCLAARCGLPQVSSAAVGKQSRKHKPLIPEFKHVITVAADAVTKDMKVLREVSFQGEFAGDHRLAVAGDSSLANKDFDKEVEPPSGVVTLGASPSPPSGSSRDPPQGKSVKVGVYHSPSDFCEMAKNLQHPFDYMHPVASITKEAVDFLMNSSPEQVALHRKLALLKLQLIIKRSEKEEERLHASMEAPVAKVMKGKKIVALRTLLEQEGYDDLAAVDFLSNGVGVLGSEEHPSCFEKKVKPATLTEECLRETARARREAIIADEGRCDKVKAKLLQEVTQEEAKLGFLDGPYSAEEITNLVGHEHWCVIRRFLLDQGSKQRPIDDACQSQTNAAYSTTICLELHNADYIASVALFIAKKVKEGRQRFGSGDWVGKCLDLTKAYKQLALHPSHRDLCVTYFRGPDGKEMFFLPNSLMFGATAAVYGFIRVSRCLWFLVNRCLRVPSAVYFDDYPIFTPCEGSKDADEAVSQFLSMLGWDHAKTGQKGKPCASSFDVLGMTLDLSQVRQGLVTLRNKPGRAEKMLEAFEEVDVPEAITRHQIQVLHGLLNFAAGFLAGRSLKHVCYDLLELLEWRGNLAFARLKELARRTREILEGSPPRLLSCLFAPEPILIWTDGSWECGVAGIGACVWDPLAQAGQVFAGEAPAWALDAWRADFDTDKEPQLICHIELFVMVTVRWMLAERLLNRRVILFVDNESARFAILKGGSNSRGMSDLVRAFDRPDLKHPMLYWVDRVPSYSNVADGPSKSTDVRRWIWKQWTSLSGTEARED
ncbi:unnamed protein product, partial [Symbiodinium sp. CCMP2456]